MKKFLTSFVFAAKGIKSVFSSETNMKVHAAISVFVILMGFVFEISTVEWLACILCIGLVFTVEIFNTSIETLVDLISPQKNMLAGKTKDIAAGAVLVAAIMSVVVGIIIFLPKLLNLIY